MYHPAQSNIIHGEIFLLHHAKLGVQCQKLGCNPNRTPCSNVEPVPKLDILQSSIIAPSLAPTVNVKSKICIMQADK